MMILHEETNEWEVLVLAKTKQKNYEICDCQESEREKGERTTWTKMNQIMFKFN